MSEIQYKEICEKIVYSFNILFDRYFTIWEENKNKIHFIEKKPLTWDNILCTVQTYKELESILNYPEKLKKILKR